MIDDSRLHSCLAEVWGLSRATVRVHHGGMNSGTWFVEAGSDRWVAKAVAGPAARFATGLQVATRVQAAGVSAGAPVPAANGDLAIQVDAVALALLTWVAGDPLAGAGVDEQELIGRTLARVHRGLAGATAAAAQRFHWLDPEAEHLGIRPWIRPAVAAAVGAYERPGTEPLTQGLLHADPAPEAFRYDPTTGTCGLIDWSEALVGPLMYDLSSAVMYVGGPARAHVLLDAYLRHGVLPREEVDRTLPVMLRLRWAVQADYFARRIHTGDMTGIAGPADNETGLEHARQRLASPEP